MSQTAILPRVAPRVALLFLITWGLAPRSWALAPQAPGLAPPIPSGRSAPAAPAVAAAPAAQDSPFPAATPESQGISAEAMKGLAAVARGYVENDLAVGSELLVIKNRRTILHEAFGMADRESGVAMAPGTIFNLRSMTKMFTGAAIQLLIDQGDLELDMKAADFLEGFRNGKSESITIGELLAHRSGLQLSILMKTGKLDAYPDLIAMANAVGAGGPEFPPDSKFWYSDSGTDCLAAIVEVVSGRNIAQFVSERLFAPLGMSDTFYLSKTTPHDQSRVASLYIGSKGTWTRGWNARQPAFYPYPWGSQTAFGTLEDYARFVAMLLDHGRRAKAEVLTNEAVERILTPRSLMTELGSDTPFPTGYRGLTPWYGEMSVLHLPTTSGSENRAAKSRDNTDATSTAKPGDDAAAKPAAKPIVIGHSGSDGTIVWAFPDRDLIILYFTQSRGGLTPIRLETEIDRLLLHPGAPEPAPERFAPYLARYHDGYSEVGVVVNNGHLAFDLPDSLVFELTEPADGKSWNAPTGGFSIVFEHAPAPAAATGAANGVAGGAITGLEIHAGVNTRKFALGAALPEPAVDAAKLAAIAGDYRDGSSPRINRIVVEGRRLAVVLATKAAEMTLFAPDEKGWWALLSDPTLSIHFDFASDGTVTSATSRLESPERTWTKVVPKAGAH